MKKTIAARIQRLEDIHEIQNLMDDTNTCVPQACTNKPLNFLPKRHPESRLKVVRHGYLAFPVNFLKLLSEAGCAHNHDRFPSLPSA